MKKINIETCMKVRVDKNVGGLLLQATSINVDEGDILLHILADRHDKTWMA